MKSQIRKISIGSGVLSDCMKYSIGQSVFGGHEIVDIEDLENDYIIWIKKDGVAIKWKSFNKNMAISLEYNLNF